MKLPRLLLPAFFVLCLLTFSSSLAGASTAYGTLNNFDVVNDTGSECHGFEIEIEDLHSRDITHTYNWNHYGTPRITEDNSDPLHPRVRIRYESARSTNGAWAAYTAIPSGPIAPTDGHRFTNPSVNFGGEHFGVGYYGRATNITYHWLVDDGSGTLVRGAAVIVATPTFSYYAPAGGAPARVQAVIAPPPAPPVREFGPASWVKEIRTTSHNNREVKLRDLVSDDPDDDDDKNWRNDEPDEVEVEWELLQTEFNAADGGNKGKLEGAPEDLEDGDEVITRRYEFYEYVGPIDPESGEADTDNVGPDGIHGVDEYEDTVVVGTYLGAQMSAFDVDAPVSLIEHVQDGEINQPYPTRTLVIAGGLPFVATNSGALPDGMTFNPVSGELSGTPTVSGVFPFTVEARAGNDPVVRKSYTLTIAEEDAALPARSTVDTAALPINAGSTTGDGSYTNGTTTTVTAASRAGFAFTRWTDNGKPVSDSASYTFTNIVNRSLVANFAPVGPALSLKAPQAGTLAFTWPTNPPGLVLQQSTDMSTANWILATNVVSIVGTNNRVIISPLTGSRFFRLLKP